MSTVFLMFLGNFAPQYVKPVMYIVHNLLISFSGTLMKLFALFLWVSFLMSVLILNNLNYYYRMHFWERVWQKHSCIQSKALVLKQNPWSQNCPQSKIWQSICFVQLIHNIFQGFKIKSSVHNHSTGGGAIVFVATS